MSSFQDSFGQTVVNVHSENEECRELGCVIHNPTDHNLRHLPLRWREAGVFDVKPSHFERICEHGVGHPDPDSVAYHARNGRDYIAIHGCDGCCT